MLAMSRKIARGVGQDSRTAGQQDSQRAGREEGVGEESSQRARAKHGDIVIIMPKIILRLSAHAQPESERDSMRGCEGDDDAAGYGNTMSAERTTTTTTTTLPAASCDALSR